VKKVTKEDIKNLVTKYGVKRVKESIFAVMGKTRPDGYREPENSTFKYDPEKINEAMSDAEIKKMHQKYKETGELPPHLKKMLKGKKDFEKKFKVKNIVVPGLEWMADIKEVKLTEGPDPVKMIKLYAPIVKGTMNNMVVAINKDDYKKLKKFHQQFNFYTKKVSEFAEEFID
jgi:hypothetical protein